MSLEKPMSDLAVRWSATHWPRVSISLKVVCLLCILGLVVTVAILPLIAPAELNWVLSHLE
jgi:hypothetical protein